MSLRCLLQPLDHNIIMGPNAWGSADGGNKVELLCEAGFDSALSEGFAYFTAQTALCQHLSAPESLNSSQVSVTDRSLLASENVSNGWFKVSLKLFVAPILDAINVCLCNLS